MGLPIKRVRLEQYQRTDETDGNAFGALGLDALYQSLKAMLGTGWVTLGALDPVGPGRACTLRAPTAAITPEGIAITSTDQTVTPGANASGDPRIDLVSISWTETDTDSDERDFINPISKVIAPQNTNTRKTWSAPITLTAGVPDPDPSAPATPANHVALYEILVEDGATEITAADITPVASAANLKVPQLSKATWAGVGAAVQPLPYTTPTLLAFAAKGSVTVITVDLDIISVGSLVETVMKRPLILELLDDAAAAVIGRSEVQLTQGQRSTVRVVGFLSAPSAGSRNYKVRIKDAGSGSGTVNTGVIVPAIYDSGDAIANPIFAVSL